MVTRVSDPFNFGLPNSDPFHETDPASKKLGHGKLAQNEKIIQNYINIEVKNKFL